MNLKRNNWLNPEVTNILEGCKLSINMDEAKNWTDEEYKHATAWNEGLDYAINYFYDFSRSEKDASAKAYDIETNLIFAVGPILPQ